MAERRCQNCQHFALGVTDEQRKAWDWSNFGRHADGVCTLYFPRGYIGRKPPHPAMSSGRCFQWEEKSGQMTMWGGRVMDDLISRQDVINAVLASNFSACTVYGRSEEGMATAKELIQAIKNLPSAHCDNRPYPDEYVKEKEDALRWIPVSERLPEPCMAVLGYAPKYQNIYALYYDSVCGWMIWNPIRDDCLPESQGEITAWMPLPDPYKEGEA